MKMDLGLIELFGLGGFILGILNLYLLWEKHRKDKPIIEIKKNSYKKCFRFDELKDDKEYSDAVDKAIAETPKIFDNYELRNLIVDITNNGHRDAKLKKVQVWYEQKGRNSFSPKVINFWPTTISAGDREPKYLFFEFPRNIIERIEKTLPNTIIVEFDFAHKKIKKKFVIRENSFSEKK